jgi:hypothetical protein
MARKTYKLPPVSADEILARYELDFPEGEEKGYRKWSPDKRTAQIREDINKVLTQYWDYWPLGPRQIGYVLIGGYGYTKGDSIFNRVEYVLNRSRRANRMVSHDGGIRSYWEAVADGRTPDPLTPDSWDSPADFFGHMRRWAETYSCDLQDGQKVVIEIWVETASLAPQVALVAHDYGVPVYPSSGEVAILPKRELALRAVERARKEIQTMVFQVGDYDGKGVAIFRAFEADVMAFVAQHGQDGMVACERLAVTPAQVDHYTLDRDKVKMPKPKEDGTVTLPPGPPLPYNTQAEALNPEQLAEVVRGGIGRFQDPRVRATTQTRSEEERQVILDAIDTLDEVI